MIIGATYIIVGIGIGWILRSMSEFKIEVEDIHQEISNEDLKESLEDSWKQFDREMHEFKQWKIKTGRFYCHMRAEDGEEVCTEPCAFCQQDEYKYKRYYL
jgi:biotin-(acetyl-CoA carboxylase) ligase